MSDERCPECGWPEPDGREETCRNEWHDWRLVREAMDPNGHADANAPDIRALERLEAEAKVMRDILVREWGWDVLDEVKERAATPGD